MRNFFLLVQVCIISSSLNAEAVSEADASLTIDLDDMTKLTFVKVSPSVYKIDYPAYHVLETEVTNQQYKMFLQAIGETKDDTEVARIVAQRRRSGSFSTANIPYSVEDESAIWRSNTYPDGMADHPVTLVTLHDAERFAKWLDAKYAKGRVRLPTWNEWMLAAYGSDRAYPWGNTWKPENLHSSHGHRVGYSSNDKVPKRTEAVKARPKGRTPEGIFGMLGNADEYICSDDPASNRYFNLGSRSMGGGFTDGLMLFEDQSRQGGPRNDYWGYSHHTTQRQCDLGFRLVLVPAGDNDAMLKHVKFFEQNNKSWMTDSDEEKDNR